MSPAYPPRSDRDPWCWKDGEDGVAVCFAGQGSVSLDLADSVRALVPSGLEPAWLSQVHSADVVDAVAGCAGKADALVTRRRDLALTIVTADCVPVLVAGGEDREAKELAAVHAGWRGVAGRIVPAAIGRLGGRPAEMTAWIGPAIGPCCYEVGEDVAARVTAGLAARERNGLTRPGPRGRPYLDLPAVVERQLRAEGVVRIRRVEGCTRCEAGLWSYRRDGRAAGRNLAVIYPVGLSLRSPRLPSRRSSGFASSARP